MSNISFNNFIPHTSSRDGSPSDSSITGSNNCSQSDEESNNLDQLPSCNDVISHSCEEDSNNQSDIEKPESDQSSSTSKPNSSDSSSFSETIVTEPIVFSKIRTVNHGKSEIKCFTEEFLQAIKDQSQIIFNMIDENPEIIEFVDYLQNNILHHAAKAKNLDLIQFLIEKKQMSPDTQNMYGETPFLLACKSGNENVFYYFFQKDELLFAKDRFNNSVLNSSIVNGNLDFIQQIIEFNLKFKQSQGEDITKSFVELLNDTNISGNSPLLNAARFGKKDIIYSFINTCESDGQIDNLNLINPITKETIFDIAARVGDYELFSYLQEKFKNRQDFFSLLNNNDNWKRTILHNALKGKNVKIIKSLNDLGVNLFQIINQRDLFYKQTPMELAKELDQTLSEKKKIVPYFNSMNPIDEIQIKNKTSCFTCFKNLLNRLSSAYQKEYRPLKEKTE